MDRRLSLKRFNRGQSTGEETETGKRPWEKLAGLNENQLGRTVAVE